MSRPAFPVRLATGPAAKPVVKLARTSVRPQTAMQTALEKKPFAIKNIAAYARNHWASGLKDIENKQIAGLPSGIGLESAIVRQSMVQKLAAQGITDVQVLHAMAQVPRHRFVDSALVNQAYEDTSLPIGLGQTISKPNVVARMIELLRAGHASRTGRVLEIGTGCGYQAAVLAAVCTEVYSIERLRGLHDKARDNLRAFRLANVHLLLGDGMLGYAQGAPYAGIIAAAGGDAIPQAWIDQLAIGGRIVAPLVQPHGTRAAQVLVVVDKTSKGVTHSVLEAVHFVPLKSGVA